MAASYKRARRLMSLPAVSLRPRPGVRRVTLGQEARRRAHGPDDAVFAPRGKDFTCFEPMTAPTNALVSGKGLGFVAPGGSFSAAFRISVEATG